MLSELADVRMACAGRSVVPDELELWQIAGALGVHRPHASDRTRAGHGGLDRESAELMEAVRRQRAGEDVDWSSPPPGMDGALVGGRMLHG